MDVTKYLPTFSKLFGAKPKTEQPKAMTGSAYGNQPYFLGSQSSGGKWPYGLSTPFSSLTHDHYRLRQGARAAMQDSPEGRAIVESQVNTIVHTGLKLEPTPDISVLGITQEQATQWAKNVASRWALYASDKKQHRSETMTLNQFQWLYTFFYKRENDVFVRLYYNFEDKYLQSPLQFEFLDPDQIRGDAYTTSYGMQCHHDGIIRDERNREIGYKIWNKKKDGTYEEVEIPAKKDGIIFMLHGFKPEYAGQGRGFTKMAPILQELENLTDFKLSHIKMAINQAIMHGWIVPSKDEDAQSIFDGQLTQNGGAGAYIPETEASPAEPTDTLSEFVCHRVPEATFDNPGIFLQNLTKGADIKFGNPNAPVSSYDKFTDSFLTNLAAASGTSREYVQMKFGSNYAANRGTMILVYRAAEIEKEEVCSDFLNQVQEMWLMLEISAGRISAPGWSDPRLRAAWLKRNWRGIAIPDIDPAKLAKAYRDQVEIGINSAESISQTVSGKSAADNIAMNNQSYEGYEAPPWSKMAEKETETPEPEENEMED